MKIACLLAALLLVPSFATPTAAHVRSDKSDHRARVGARLREYGNRGRQIAAPPWSFACTNDTGPQTCDEPMWVYGSPDYIAQFKNAF